MKWWLSGVCFNHRSVAAIRASRLKGSAALGVGTSGEDTLCGAAEGPEAADGADGSGTDGVGGCGTVTTGAVVVTSDSHLARAVLNFRQAVGGRIPVTGVVARG